MDFTTIQFDLTPLYMAYHKILRVSDSEEKEIIDFLNRIPGVEACNYTLQYLDQNMRPHLQAGRQAVLVGVINADCLFLAGYELGARGLLRAVDKV